MLRGNRDVEHTLQVPRDGSRDQAVRARQALLDELGLAPRLLERMGQLEHLPPVGHLALTVPLIQEPGLSVR